MASGILEEDTRGKLVYLMAFDYISKINGKVFKNKNKARMAYLEQRMEEQITFADIIVWFYKKNCPQSLTVAQSVWDKLPETLIQKQRKAAYFEAYAEQITDTHAKYASFISKRRKLDRIISRTNEFIANLNKIIISSANPEINDGSISNLDLSLTQIDELPFDIVVDHIEGHDFQSILGRKDYVGHQLAFGYEDKKCTSTLVNSHSFRMDFNQEKIRMRLKLKAGTVSMSLVEMFEYEGKGFQLQTVAFRNLDLFASINDWFMRDLLSNNDAVQKITNTDTSDSDKEEEERRRYRRVFDTFSFKKSSSSNRGSMSSAGDTHRGHDDSEYVNVHMSIEIPLLKDIKDLRVYEKLCKKRVEFLQQKMTKLREKSSLYKQKLALLIAPFETVSFDEKNIDFSELVKEHSKNACTIF